KVHDPVAAFRVEPEPQAVRPGSEVERGPGAPTLLGRAGDRDVALPRRPGPGERFTQHLLLQRELAGVVQVLVGAAAARREERAGRGPPAGPGCEQLFDLGARIAGGERLHAGADTV